MKAHNFLSILKAEHYKSKRNWAVLAILLFPVLLSILTLLYMSYKLFTESSGGMYLTNPWTSLLGQVIIALYSFLYPFLIAILCYSLCENEYKNDNYKQLFTLPVSIVKIYCAKIVYLIEIIVLTILIAYATFLFSAFVLGVIFPQLPFHDYDMNGVIFIYFLKLFIALLAIGIVQYCLSLTFKSFIIPLGANCFLTIFTFLFTYEWEHYYLVIYNASFRAYNAFRAEVTQLSESEYWNIIYIILFIIMGYFIFKKKK